MDHYELFLFNHTYSFFFLVSFTAAHNDKDKPLRSSLISPIFAVNVFYKGTTDRIVNRRRIWGFIFYRKNRSMDKVSEILWLVGNTTDCVPFVALQDILKALSIHLCVVMVSTDYKDQILRKKKKEYIGKRFHILP